MKRIFVALVLVSITVALSTAASSRPNTTITLIQGLPSSMNVGEEKTVLVKVTSDQEFLQVQALPSFAYPGKGVVAVQGGDRVGRGTSALLEVTFEAKSSTAKMPDGAAIVYVVVGVRYPGGYVVPQEFPFSVAVP
jgi:hypothetical protein